MNDQTVDYDDYFKQAPAPVTQAPNSTVDYDSYFGNQAQQQSQGKQQDWESKLYHAVIPGITMGIGGTAAGILASPSGPVGSAAAGVAGGAAMYGPGQQAANAIDKMRGIQPQPSTTAQDIQTGLGAEAGGALLGTAFKGAGAAITSGFKKFISAALGPSDAAITAQMANPDIVNSPDFSQLARSMPKTLGILKDRITAATENASSLLSDDPSQNGIPSSQVTGLLGNLRQDLETSGTLVGDARTAAAAKLDKLTSTISQIMKPEAPAVQLVDSSGKNIPFNPPDVTLPQTTVKDVLQAVRSNINWQDMGATETNAALTKFSGQLDSLLKVGADGQPTDYALAMKPVSKMMGTLDDVMSDFSMEQPTGKGIQPTDTTISKLQSVLGDKKSFSQDVLNELKAATGMDYMGASQNASYAKQFQGGSAQGSRKVNFFGAMGAAGGGAVGGIAGHPGVGAGIGSAVGGGVGALADKYGGPMAANLVDHYSAISSVIDNLSKTIGATAAKNFVSAALAQQLNSDAGPSQ